MKKYEKICIVCPIGCRLNITKQIDNKNGYIVKGNMCKRGEEYGLKEITNPTRVLTSTVKIKGGHLKRLPVKTNGDIPKEKIFECMKLINAVDIEAPVKVGDILIKNILYTNIDVVATRSMDKI